MPRSIPIGLLALFAAGMIYQLAAILDLSRSPFFGNPILDARYQVEWAFALASGNDLHPVFFQSPLFSYVLAAFLWLFDWSVWGVVLFQWLLLFLVAVLVYRTLLLFEVERHLRYVLTAVVLFYPLYPYYASMLHKTALEIFAHALVLYLGVRLVTSSPSGARALGIAFLFGFGCGLAALIRSTFQALAVLPCFFMEGRRLARIFTLAAGFLVPVGWALLHNHRGAGEWVPLQTSFGFTLFLGNNSFNPQGAQVIVPGLSNNPLEEESSSRAYAEKAAGKPLSVREVNSFYVGKVVDFLSAKPAAFLSAQARKLYWYLHREELPDNDCYRCIAGNTPALSWSPLSWGWIVLVALPATFVLIGSWVWTRSSPRGELFVFFFALALLGTVLTFYVSSRLRIGHVAVWLVVTGLGLRQAWIHRRTHAKAVASLLAAGGLLGMTLMNQPLPEYPADETTLKLCWMYNDLDRFDEASAVAKTLRDPARRGAMLLEIDRLRQAPADPGRRLELLSRTIPHRR